MPQKYNCNLIVDYCKAREQCCSQMQSCNECPVKPRDELEVIPMACRDIDYITPERIAALQAWSDAQYKKETSKTSDEEHILELLEQVLALAKKIS